MKLQKRFNRKVGEKEYAKWIVNLPPEKIESVGWKEGVELQVDVRDGKLILREKPKES